MAKTIKGGRILLELDDGRTIELFAKKTKKAKGAVDDLAKSEATLNRNFKGASQQSSNTTKNFSKMAQGITGGLVPAYATLAANIFAIGAAFRFLQSAADFRILMQGQAEFATRTGESLSLLTSRLREATGGQLAFAEAAQAVAIGRAAGLSGDQLNRLGKVAKNASLALGRDLTDSFNRLVRGAVKAEPELLDELGIILRLETATKKYADEIGKTANSLNIFEKTQAVVNEVLTQGEEKFGEFNTQLNAFNKLAVAFDDLLNKIKGALSGVAEFIATALSKNVIALTGAFALLGSGILSAVTPEIPKIDMAKAGQAAQADVGKFYTGKRLGKFQQGTFTGADIAAVERSFKAKSSTVLNFERMTRAEAQKTMLILKAQRAQMEADNSRVHKKMYLSFKANLALMQAEYGKFMGFMKLMGRGLTKFIGFLGWAGLIVSLIGVLAQLTGVFDTNNKAAEAAAQAQKKTANAFEETANEVRRLNAELILGDTVMTNLIKRAKQVGNLNFTGAGSQFGEMGQRRRFEVFGYGVLGQEKNRLSENQKKIAQGTLDQLLGTADNLQGEAKNRVLKLAKPIQDILAKDVITDADFKTLKDQLTLIEKEGLDALGLKDLGLLNNLDVLLKNTGESYTKALRDLRPSSTALTNMTNAVRDQKDILEGMIKVTGNPDFKNLFSGEENSLFAGRDKDTIAAMIGSENLANIMAPITDETTGKIREGVTLAEKTAVTTQIRTKLAERQLDLEKDEIRLMNGKLNIETNLLNATRGQGKLTTAQLKKEANVLKIKEEIFAIENKQKQREISGTAADSVVIENENKRIENLNAKLKTAEREANLLQQVGDTFRNSFEVGMASAFQNIIEGTKTMKEAFGEMARAILSSLAQILAQQAAIQVMQLIPGLPGIGGRYGGIMSPTGRSFRAGGEVSGPESGYPVTLHGTEAVVPLGNDRHIPVKFENGGSSAGPVTVNVNMTSGETETTGEDQFAFGKAIASAVQQEIAKQQRPGGTLSPY